MAVSMRLEKTKCYCSMRIAHTIFIASKGKIFRFIDTDRVISHLGINISRAEKKTLNLTHFKRYYGRLFVLQQQSKRLNIYALFNEHKLLTR